MAQAPKAFISHASEDKSGFAAPLARTLRGLGVEAWLDMWEIRPGDNLVDKIFNEGLGEADACVYLMSTNSVNKDWVRAEFESAVAQSVKKKIRLIPVKLDECNVPNSLSAIRWIDLASCGSIENVAEAIAKTMFGHSDRPPVGPRPIWTETTAFGDLFMGGSNTQEMVDAWNHTKEIPGGITLERAFELFMLLPPERTAIAVEPLQAFAIDAVLRAASMDRTNLQTNV